MKFIGTFIATAAAVSAAALPRDSSENVGTMNITQFAVTGSRFSIYEYYRLNVTDGADQTFCSTTTSEGANIAPFGYTPCESGPWSFAWLYINWSNPGPGYSLQVTKEIGSTATEAAYNKTGCLFFPETDVKSTNDQNPNANYQYLDAPQEFTMQWTKGSCIYG